MQLNPKHSLEVSNAKKWLMEFKRACVIAHRWMYFWFGMSYLIDGALFLCVLANSANLQFDLVDDKMIKIGGIIILILKTLSSGLKANDRAVYASVVKDNFDEASELIENKIADLEVIAQNGVQNDEIKSWKDINDYISNIVKISKKWPSRFIIQTEKIDKVQDQISQRIFDNDKIDL